MNLKNSSIALVGFLVLFSGCSTSSYSVKKVDQPTVVKPKVIKKPIEKSLKRKVAIARFTNEAQYGKSALFGLNNTYKAEKQATDILSAKLTRTNKFILLERDDLDLINKELNYQKLDSMNIGANYLVVGSITEFGRKNLSDTGVFSRKKVQIAYAKVSIRLVDVKTGQIIFAQEGSGESKSEAGTAFGVGKHVGYDSTLNDKAISAAISSVVDGLLSNLLNKPWRSYVLSSKKGNVIIAGGAKQGIKVNDEFNVYKKGETIKNPQTGMNIELPGEKVATIKVVTTFGNTYTDEGSVCRIVSGNIAKYKAKDLYVEK